jgi:hypothetical protein
MDLDSFEMEFEKLMDELVLQQQEKVLRTARMRNPRLTGDDVLNPHDFPELMADPIFNYEEGLAAGLLTAQIAMRARLLRPLRENPIDLS